MNKNKHDRTRIAPQGQRMQRIKKKDISWILFIMPAQIIIGIALIAISEETFVYGILIILSIFITTPITMVLAYKYRNRV